MTTMPSSQSPRRAAAPRVSASAAAARVSWVVSLTFLGWLAATGPTCLAGEACQVGDATLADAVQRHQAGDVAGAIDPYRRYLSLCPKRADVRSNLGAALAHLGRYDEAIAEYGQALADDTDNAAIRMNLAIALYKAERLREAARELETLRTLQPTNTKGATLLADCYLRLGENKKVIDVIAPLAQQSPDDLALAYLLGTALIQDGQFEKGGVFVDRILRKEDTAEAHALMGQARQGARDNLGAVKELARAAELNPKLPGVHRLYGLALLEIDDRAAAGDEFARELANDPNDFESHRQLGILLKLQGKYDDARSHLDRALQLRPGALDVRYELATLMISLGQLDEALARLEAIAAEAPSFPGAHVSLATLYYRLGRREEGDRQRDIVRRLNAEREKAAQQPAAPGPSPIPAAAPEGVRP